MKIKGIQKLTLIDYPEKLACTLFLFGCNFKCGFCHNPELVISEEQTDHSKKEILEFLEKRKKYLEGVCITGGEPLLNLDEEFLRQIKSLGYLIKLDTNGTFPDKLQELIDKNLIDFVAMDIKASKENYSKVVCSEIDLEKIEKSIKIISRLPEYEFRTTIVEDIHDKEELKKIALWLNKIIEKKPKNFSIQGFKNNGKLLDETFKNKKNISEDYLIKLKKSIDENFEKVEIKA